MERAASAFRERGESAGIFLDFDGTLSEIVDVPSEARPVAGARAVLAHLARRLAVVSVVSGRSAAQLLDWLGPDVEIWGLHGAERTVDGEVVLAPRAAAFAPLMQEVFHEAQDRVAEGSSGLIVENKRVMVALHYRAVKARREAGEFLAQVAADLASRFGLTTVEGRLVYELRPPVDFTKAEVLRSRAEEAGLETVGFAGDDRVDLPAFDVLDELEARGVTTLRIAVTSDEAPRELLQRADVTVAGPREMVVFLEQLVDDQAS